MEKIGDKLREKRNTKGVGQKILADYLGIDTKSYSRMETGDTQPTIEKLLLLADYYGEEKTTFINSILTDDEKVVISDNKGQFVGFYIYGNILNQGISKEDKAFYIKQIEHSQAYNQILTEEIARLKEENARLRQDKTNNF